MDLKTQIRDKAFEAARNYLDTYYGGQDLGACGFAWVTIYPQHKGNTTLGREERRLIRALGAKLDHTGKTFQIWNPAKIGCQNIDAKEAGARVAAEILNAHGFKASANSRLD